MIIADMKKKYLRFAAVIVTFVVIFIIYRQFGFKNPEPVIITYPIDQTVFPKDMAPPAFAWKDDNPGIIKWQITVNTGETTIIDKFEV